MSLMSRAAIEPQSAESFAVVLRWIAGFGRALLLHWYRRAAIKSLSELDDRALREWRAAGCDRRRHWRRTDAGGEWNTITSIGPGRWHELIGQTSVPPDAVRS